MVTHGKVCLKNRRPCQFDASSCLEECAIILPMSSYFEQAWSLSNEVSVHDNLPGFTWYVHRSCCNSIAWDNKTSNRFGGNMISGGRYSIRKGKKCFALTALCRFPAVYFAVVPSGSLERQILFHSSSLLCTYPSMTWTWEIYKEWCWCFRRVRQSPTQSIDVFGRYGCSALESRCVNIEVRPWVDRLRSIRNISVQGLDISFARERIE